MTLCYLEDRGLENLNIILNHFVYICWMRFNNSSENQISKIWELHFLLCLIDHCVWLEYQTGPVQFPSEYKPCYASDKQSKQNKQQNLLEHWLMLYIHK